MGTSYSSCFIRFSSFRIFITKTMKILVLLSAFLASINCLPKPDPYKESIPHTPGLGGYGDTHVKTKYGSFDFDEPSKLEFSEISASPGTSDLGPKDVAAELHAKIEEAAQHALAIIDGAKTFAEEAEKEQAARQDPIKI